MYFTDQNWVHKTVYCITCVIVCKIGFTNWNAKIVLLRESMRKPFQTVADRHNGILMSLLLLVAETISLCFSFQENFYTICDLQSFSLYFEPFGYFTKFTFNTSETMDDFYLKTWYIRVASKVAEQLKT